MAQLAVNDKARAIQRTERKGAQLYAVSPGSTVMSGESVTVAYTYRVLLPATCDVSRPAQPTKGLKVQLSYGDAGIWFTALDFIGSVESARVQDAPNAVPRRSVAIGFDGWSFPRSGMAFVWVLEEEMEGDRGDHSKRAVSSTDNTAALTSSRD